MIYLRNSFEIAIITTSQTIKSTILIAMITYTRGRSGRAGVAIQLCMAVTGEVYQSRRSAFGSATDLDVAGAAAV
jgi:hypothetical protein